MTMPCQRTTTYIPAAAAAPGMTFSIVPDFTAAAAGYTLTAPARFVCMGKDVTRFCCARNGCHPVCNCSL